VPPFPAEALESGDSPNIYITSPTSATPSRFPPPLSMNFSSQSLQSLHSISSPGSSPTQSEDYGPHHHVHPHTLSRQHSFYRSENGAGVPPSPVPGDEMIGDEGGAEPVGRQKRQRTSSGHGYAHVQHGHHNGMVGISLNGETGPGSAGASPVMGGGVPAGKRLARARSDSAPLGMGLNAWQGGGGARPRSGSGMAPQGRGVHGGIGMSNIGSLLRGPGGGNGATTPGGPGAGGGPATTTTVPPMLAIPTLPSNPPSR
jgi:hypothetical protein